MSSPEIRHRMVGHGDLIWLAMLTLVVGLVVYVLLGHLKNQHQFYRVGDRAESIILENRALELQNSELLGELLRLRNAVDDWEAGRELGLGAASPEQTLQVDAP